MFGLSDFVITEEGVTVQVVQIDLDGWCVGFVCGCRPWHDHLDFADTYHFHESAVEGKYTVH